MEDKKRGREIFESQLPLIEELIGRTCSGHRLDGEEAEDFSSFVMLKLIENGYRRLEKFKGNSSLRTYLTTVVERLLLDFRCQKWGKWRPSSRAKKLGRAATLLETLLYRDGFSFPAAEGILRRNHGLCVSTDGLRRIMDDCPVRSRRFLGEETIRNMAAPRAPDGVFDGERTRSLGKLESGVNHALRRLSEEDRLLLKMRFEDGLSVAQIARELRREPKRLYRRIHKILRQLREALEAQGVERGEVLEALGTPRLEIDFFHSQTGVERNAERSLHD
jgi:RNA polymerase sigma factor for flagellar operon FliA